METECSARRRVNCFENSKIERRVAGCQHHPILAISLAAMSYGEDLDGVPEVMEADAVVSDTETEFRRFDVMEPLRRQQGLWPEREECGGP